MAVSLICERFGWTYQEYLDQPEEFTQAIMARLEVEAEMQQMQTEKAKHEAERRRN